MEYSEIALQQVRERRLLIDRLDTWLYEEIAPYLGTRVLEVGCGLGNFAHHLTNRELYVGSDISRESVTHLTNLYRSYLNMSALVADVTDSEFVNLAYLRFDTVVSVNVFEHIEDDLRALRNVAEVVRPGGNVILIVPAHPRLFGTMDRSIGHFRRYTARSMADKVSAAGLICVNQKYVNILGALGWFVNGRLFRQSVPPSSQLQLINVLIPAIRALERTVRVPVGISLLTIAQRPINQGGARVS